MDGLSESIKALTTTDQWEGALSLFNGGGVMKVQISSKNVEARVVNEHGGLEDVRISNRNSCLTGHCSCKLHLPWCKHTIAVMLLLAQEAPEFLSCLVPVEVSDGGADGSSSIEINADLNDGVSASPLSLEAIHNFLSQTSRAVLRLDCPSELPQLKMTMQRLSLTATLTYKGTDYAMGNIRKLVETGSASGGMSMNSFSPQAQQVMQFLVRHALFSNVNLSLDSVQAVELFHCLRGSDILHTPSGVVRFSLEPLQILFCVSERDEESAVIEPHLCAPSRGVLDKANLSFIVGHAGYWVGHTHEYWWCPAVIPFNWLRLFINGGQIKFSLNELSTLTRLCEEGTFPGTVKFEEMSVMEELPVGRMKPVLTLDWHPEGLVADLQFDYGGKRVEVYGERVIWLGKQFVQRDSDGEKETMNRLVELGFEQVDESWHGMLMSDKKKIYTFIMEVAPTLQPKWSTFWTPQVRLNAMMSSEAVLSMGCGTIRNGWFETECSLRTAEGSMVPFELAVEAIENDDAYIRLANGTVVHLKEDVFELIRTLVKFAKERHDNRLGLDAGHAIALSDLIEPYWTGERPDWISLKEDLLHPERIKNAVENRYLPRSLRKYQRDGVKWLAVLERNNFNGILADEMGLGKTLQALGTLLLRVKTGRATGPSIVVCPTSLMENWRDEARKFTSSLKVLIISGADRTHLFKRISEYDLVITSYALLRRDIFEYEEYEFDYVVLDEAQHIKNPRTANAQACRELRSAHRLILTGTPIENSLSEIWSLFSFLQPGYLGTLKDFRNEYESKRSDEQNAQATKKLSAFIRPFVLRRTKKEVCEELPPKLEQEMFCEMGEEQQRLYDNLLLASRAFLSKIRSSGLEWSEQRMEMLAMITRLRQVCCHPMLLPSELRGGMPQDMASAKMELAQEVILEAIDSGHRVLFFSQFTSMLKKFMPWLDKSGIIYETLDGSTKNRQAVVDRFNADPTISVFLLSLKAGGVGLNLQGADTVIHYDQWWNPMVEDQATDRSHRIGQTRTVTSIRLVTRNTIEEKILKLQDEKRRLFNDVLANTPTALCDITEDDVNFILS